jgi:hypothetical protein
MDAWEGGPGAWPPYGPRVDLFIVGRPAAGLINP